MAKVHFCYTSGQSATMFGLPLMEKFRTEGVDVVCMWGDDIFSEFLQKKLKDLNIGAKKIKMSRRPSLALPLEFARVLLWVLSAGRSEIFVTNNPKVSFLFAILFWMKITPNVVHISHGLVSFPAVSIKTKILFYVEKFILMSATKVIFVSRSLLGWVIERGSFKSSPKNWTSINSIIGCKSFSEHKLVSRSISPNYFTLGYCGRINDAKGFPFYVSVLKSLRARGFHCRGLVAGNIDDGRGNSLIREYLSLDDCIYLGHQSDLSSFWREVDVLLVPSIREGFGMVALEACSEGVLCVGNDIPGLQDSIRDGVTGKLAPLNVEAFCSAVIYVVSDAKNLIDRMRNSLPERAAEYSQEIVVSKYFDIILDELSVRQICKLRL